MFELTSMTYEECRKEYFEKLKAEANRKMEYWSKRVDKEEPWNPRARANEYASEWGAVVSYLNDALKALDMMPVKHGYWIGLEYDGYADGFPVYDLWECSECGNEHKGEDTPNYCSNCGAKMDLEVRDEG